MSDSAEPTAKPADTDRPAPPAKPEKQFHGYRLVGIILVIMVVIAVIAGVIDWLVIGPLEGRAPWLQ